MKGILVAVGLGERTVRARPRGPREFGPLPESPPVDQAIEAFARAGFEEVAVILGHGEDVLWHYLEDSSRYGMAVYCLHNPQYGRGAATAIYAARAFVGGEPFVVSLSGRPPTANVLLSLQGSAPGTHAVAIDHRWRADRESRQAIKACLDREGRVCRIGRRLTHWDAVLMGTFRFQPRVFDQISALLFHAKGDCSMSALLRRMIVCGEAPYACDVSARWKGVVGNEHLLVWTAPMLSVRAMSEPVLA